MANPKTQDDWRQAPIAVYSDPIFFSKYNVKTGTRFRHFGRRRSGTTWTVVNIWTFKPGKYGRTRHNVNEVQHLDDILVLHSDSGEERTIRFGYASYSAIWRLDQ
jgi:hypothetical protein